MKKTDIAAIRMRAVAVAPYMSAALYNMVLIILEKDEDKKQVPTMAVDQYWRCYINPDFIDEIGIIMAGNTLIHEVYHLISQHGQRAEVKNIGLNHKLWNIAADMAINQDLKANGMILPDGCWYPDRINEKDGQLAEYYYDKLYEQADKIDITMIGHEGSGVTGQDDAGSYEQDTAQAQGSQQKGVSKQKGKIIRRQIAKDIQDHSKNQGNVPGGLQRWAEDQLDPKVDWTTKFISAIYGQISHQSGMVDFTYSRPSRRATLCPGIIFPKMVKPVPDVAVFIDTSGSMNQHDLNSALSEIKNIVNSLGQPIMVYTGDTQLHTKQNVWDPGEITLTGGGGTDMGQAINDVSKEKPVSILVVITDGYTGWPATKPTNINSIIACLTRKEMEDRVPDFIEAITIDIDDTHQN